MRRVLLLAVQAAITIGILILVFHDAEKRAQMAAALGSAKWYWLVCALLAAGAVEALGGIRWRILLGIQGIHVSWLTATGQLLIAVFFNLVSPGLIGGDAIRMIYVMSENPRRKSGVVAAVVMDRTMGLASLLVLAAASLLVRRSWLSQTPNTARLAATTAIILAVGFAFVAIIFVIASLHLRIPQRLPFRSQLQSAIDSLNRFRGHVQKCITAFAVTLAAHGAFYVSYFFAAQAFRDSEEHLPSLGEMFTIMPIVNTLVAMPVTIAGVGVREAIFQTLLGDLVHTTRSVAVLIGSTGFLCWAFWGLLGGALFVAFPPKPFRGAVTKSPLVSASSA